MYYSAESNLKLANRGDAIAILNEIKSSNFTPEPKPQLFSGAAAFNQDLSKWCVLRIESEPYNLNSDGSNKENLKPLPYID